MGEISHQSRILHYKSKGGLPLNVSGVRLIKVKLTSKGVVKITLTQTRVIYTMIYPMVQLFAGNFVHVVVIHSLGGSQANKHHMPSPTLGWHKSQQKWGSTSHEQSTKVAFRDLPWGIGTRPPHNHCDRSQRQAPPSTQRSSCSKSSRWRQLPRVTRDLQPTRSQVH
jgi:hypothetical protein